MAGHAATDVPGCHSQHEEDKSMTSQSSAEKREKLLEWFGDYDSCVVAFSGGIDSSVLAKAAVCALGDCAVAVYLESATSTADERAFAEKIAREIGISLTVMAGEEFGDPDFIKNTPDRCYFCKKTRFLQLAKWAESRRIRVMVEGSNADDRNDFRPGSRAAEELGVFKEKETFSKRWMWSLPGSGETGTTGSGSCKTFSRTIGHHFNQMPSCVGRTVCLDDTNIPYHFFIEATIVSIDSRKFPVVAEVGECRPVLAIE